MNSKPLANKRHELFCHKYLALKFNGQQAAIAAGYAPKSARIQASQILSILNVQERIAYLSQRVVASSELSIQKVIDELSSMAFGGLSDYGTVNADGEFVFNLKDCSIDQLNALAGYELESVSEVGKDGSKGRSIVTKTKIKLPDKPKNLELLGRYLGMFKETLEIIDHTERDAKLLAARQRAKDRDA